MSDPNEVDQVDDEQVTTSDPQLDPNGGMSGDGVSYPQPSPLIGEETKW